MTFKVIRGQGQGEEMTSVPYRDYFCACCQWPTVAVARSSSDSVATCDTLCTTGFADDVICFHTMGPIVGRTGMALCTSLQLQYVDPSLICVYAALSQAPCLGCLGGSCHSFLRYTNLIHDLLFLPISTIESAVGKTSYNPLLRFTPGLFTLEWTHQATFASTSSVKSTQLRRS